MKYIFTVVVFLMCFSACHEDSFEEEIVVTDLMEPERVVLSQVEGIVVDTSGLLISDASVTIGDMSTLTDNDGSFLLFDVPIADNGTVISVAKTNYIDNATRIFPKESLSHEVTLVLVPDPISTSINGETGAMVDDPSGVSIDILPLNFVRNGQPYTDEVTVDIYWVDINSTAQFPNGLQINEVLDIANDLEISALSNVSLGYISITDEDGDELEVNPEQPISITLPTRAETNNLAGSGPQQLLIYDPSLGFWTVEGDADAMGNAFSVEVTQFNWLAIGTERRAIPYCFNFSSTNPDETETLSYSISQADGSIVRLGQVTVGDTECFTAEADSELTLRVFSPCDEETLNQLIPTPTSESDTEVIDLDNAIDLIRFDVNFVVCNNGETPQNTLIAYSSVSGDREIPLTEENFEITLDPCDGDEELLITAVNNNQVFALSMVKLEADQRSYNVLLQGCDEPSTLILDDRVFSGIGRQARSETFIVGDGDRVNEILIGFEGFTTGTFRANLSNNDSSIGCLGVVNILQYGEVGELIVGTYCSDDEDIGLPCEFRSGSFIVTRTE